MLQPRQAPPRPAIPEPRQVPPAYPEGVWIDFRKGVESHGLEYVQGFLCSHKVTEIDGVGALTCDGRLAVPSSGLATAWGLAL